MVILVKVCRDILALDPRKRIFHIGKCVNRLLERQIIGTVVSILNSTCPRMGFLTEEKQFKTEKVNSWKETSSIIRRFGTWGNLQFQGKIDLNTAEGSFRKLCWDSNSEIWRATEEFRIYPFRLGETSRENCTYFIDFVFNWLKHQVMWSLPFALPRVPSPCSLRCREAGPFSWYPDQLCLPAEASSWDRDPATTL